MLIFKSRFSGGLLISFFFINCVLQHGLDTNYDYHVAVKLTFGASLETKWLSLP
jgi:hypothetical protein